MRRRRLWCVVLISGLGALLFTAAKPVNERAFNASRWQHVNQTCRARECDDELNYEQLRAIERNMNTSADPCQSFFNYSCGNWYKENPHSTTMSKKGSNQLLARNVEFFEGWLLQRELMEQKGVLELSARRSLAERNALPERKQLAEIREVTNVDTNSELYRVRDGKGRIESKDSYKPVESSSGSEWRPLDDPVVQKLLKYYRICKAQNKSGQHYLRAYFEASRTSVNWQLSDYNWMETLSSVGRFGYPSHFLSISVVEKNTSTYRLLIFPPDTESHIKINSEMYEVLREFTNQTKSTLQRRFYELETDLKNMYCQFCKRHTDWFNEQDVKDCDCYKDESMTFANLKSQVPEFDWERFVSTQVGRQVSPNDIVVVVNVELLRLQLEYIDTIEKELNLVFTLAHFLSYIQEQREQFLQYDEVELSCIHHMRKIMNLPMNYVYEYAYFNSKRAQSERIIEEVFDELKVQFGKMIKRNNMEFSDSIRQKIATKLEHITINIGNLPKDVPMQFYYDYIGPYSFGENFPHNHLHALEVFYKHYNSLIYITEYEKLNVWSTIGLQLPNYPDSLDMSPYYKTRTNNIILPFVYLQLPFYDSSFWPAFIYGDLASTLGHELIHAFDTEFLYFDKNGNPSSEPLASMFLNQNFRNNFVCLERGTVFVRERMADVSGARLALNTFLSLDGNALEHNGELYFLQFSQFFCSLINQGDQTHDFENLRLDYAVSALPEFSRVFNCPLGSPMNPYEKCEMYT